MQRPFSRLSRLGGETSGLSPPFIRQSILLGLMGKNRPFSGPAIRSRTRSRLPPPLLQRTSPIMKKNHHPPPNSAAGEMESVCVHAKNVPQVSQHPRMNKCLMSWMPSFASSSSSSVEFLGRDVMLPSVWRVTLSDTLHMILVHFKFLWKR